MSGQNNSQVLQVCTVGIIVIIEKKLYKIGKLFRFGNPLGIKNLK